MKCPVLRDLTRFERARIPQWLLSYITIEDNVANGQKKRVTLPKFECVLSAKHCLMLLLSSRTIPVGAFMLAMNTMLRLIFRSRSLLSNRYSFLKQNNNIFPEAVIRWRMSAFTGRHCDKFQDTRSPTAGHLFARHLFSLSSSGCTRSITALRWRHIIVCARCAVYWRREGGGGLTKVVCCACAQDDDNEGEIDQQQTGQRKLS